MRSVDYGGTLIFVSHDRYFVERLGQKSSDWSRNRHVYPALTRFLWTKESSETPPGGPSRQGGEVGRAARPGRPNHAGAQQQERTAGAQSR